MSRRDFITTSSLAAATLALPRAKAQPATASAPLIDIHMHQNAGGGPPDIDPASQAAQANQAKKGAPRTNDEFLLHQKNIGAVTSVLLGSNDATMDWARREPSRWVCFCRTSVNQPGAHENMARLLKKGAIGIGELKDNVACDSPEMLKAVELAREYDVPILIHFEDGAWNDGFSRFHRVIEKFPTVRFVGHAQTFWANINKSHTAAAGMYPKGPVTPGGLTDRWLADYPNLYADLSAGSGNNGLMRDPEFAKGFVRRHQDKLMFGSDCSCKTGVGPTCISATKLAALDALGLDATVRAKILQGNARKVLKLKSA
jgi:predicted TIM-barrel fold metal-dependent hydrolase